MKRLVAPFVFACLAAGAVAAVTAFPPPPPPPRSVPQQAARAAAPASRALPWLRGLNATVEAAEATPGVVVRMAEWRAADPTCSAAAYDGFELRADVASEPGVETVLASFTQGVLVLDARGQLIASAMPSEDCAGSADDLAGIAAGDAHIGEPVVALALTTGGHHTSTTTLVLYRVADGMVAPLFAGNVEERVGDRTRSGEVVLLRGALVFRDPSGERTLWVYDANGHRYNRMRLPGETEDRPEPREPDV
ncbi:MAG TPA: hypothetical protein VFT22_20050 [Kofleriaceae bacterium]|nr:hypothetical protein [Kofleriaceae bacterium]